MEEAELVARAIGIPLADDIVSRSLEKVLTFPYETKSSMQMDYEKGKRTEIETLPGYIVKAGKRLGIEVPLHRMVYGALTQKNL